MAEVHGRRRAPVEHMLDGGCTKKFRSGVRECARERENVGDQKQAALLATLAGLVGNAAADEAHSGERFGEPGGTNCRGRRGETKRRSRPFYRIKNGRKRLT